MTDTENPNTPLVAQRLMEAERLSLKAVLLEAGEDPLPLLREAGITEFLSVPVALDADVGAGAALSNGRGVSITGTWEPDQAEGSEEVPADDVQDSGAAGAVPGSHAQLGSRAVNLPGAFGLRPVAPIDRSN